MSERADGSLTFEERVRHRAQVVVEAFISNRGKVSWAEGLREMSSAAASEYEHRFLHELLQNGYDAMPADDSEGRIAICLNEAEDEAGVLYVANTGTPFTDADFRSLCEPARSSKEADVAIGNKGIGFRSVLQVCDRPEVYSRRLDGSGSGFDGYCFRFADEPDLRRLAGENSNLDRDELADGLPAFSVPIWCASRPGLVGELAVRGFSTVIRLPLISQRALEDVRTQVASLSSSGPPLLAFLPHLRDVELQQRTAGDTESVNLTRSGKPLGTRDSASFELVDLGSQGQYFCAHLPVDAASVQKAIRDTIAARQVSSRWADWDEDATVSVAVRIDSEIDASRMYAFLPMGADATAPFWGYLHAPFVTKLARLTVNADAPLNRLYLDRAADACRIALEFLRQAPDGWAPAAAVDLLTGTREHHLRLAAVLAEHEGTISEWSVIPVVGKSKPTSWAAIGSVHSWDESFVTLTPRLISDATSVPIVRQDLGRERMGRLVQSFPSLSGRPLAPPDDLAAEYVEKVGKHLAARRFDARRWDGYYEDIARHFAAAPQVLAGRAILLDDEGRLQHAGSDRPAGRKRSVNVFFPPTLIALEGEEEIDSAITELRVPATLRRRIVFMHRGLTWERGKRATRPRVFLQEHRLVRRYDTRSLLAHIGQLARGGRGMRLLADALRTAFLLYRAAKGAQPAVDELPLWVPTAAGGWCQAQDAVMGKGWEGSHDSALTEFLDETAGLSADLDGLRARQLSRPAEWPFPVSEQSAWKEFLLRLGVKEGLWPVLRADHPIDARGRELTPESLSTAANLNEIEASMWNTTAVSWGHADFPYTTYRISDGIHILPGQSKHTEFSIRAKALFARLVIEGMEHWPDEAFELAATSVGSRWDQVRIPTPIDAFLRQAHWLPVLMPGDRRSESHVPLHEAWHFSDPDIQAPYAPRIPSDVRVQLAARPTALSRLQDRGLRIWGNAAYAGELIRYLGQVLAEGAVAETHITPFRKAYQEAWQSLVDTGEGADPLGQGGYLAVSRAGRLEAVDLGVPDVGRIYIRDAVDKLRDELTQAVDLPHVPISPELGSRVADLLSNHEMLRRTSAASLEIIADGQSFVPADAVPRLRTSDVAWFDLVLACALEFDQSQFRRHSDKTRNEMLALFDRTRLATFEQVQIRLDGQSVSSRDARDDAIALLDPQLPTVVATALSDPPTWEDLERLIPAVAQAVNHPELTASLQYAMVRLARRLPGSTDQAPTTDDFADAFQQSVAMVDELRRSMTGSTQALVELLVPVVAYALDTDAARTFETTTVEAVHADQVRDLVGPAAAALELTADELLKTVVNCATLSDVRQQLSLDFARFNVALDSLAPRYASIQNPEGHQQAIRSFMETHRDAILAALVDRYRPVFLSALDLSEYVQARDVVVLEPPQDWLRRWYLPPESAVRQLVDQWLVSLDAHPLEPIPEGHVAVEEVRQSNYQRVVRLAGEMVAVIVAWCRRANVGVPDGWRNPDEPDAAPASFDFEPWSDERLIEWLASMRGWPEGMPVTSDLVRLQLPVDAVESARAAGDAEGQERAVHRRTILVDGERYSNEPVARTALLEKISSTISDEFLGSSRDYRTLSDLTPAATPSRVRAGGRPVIAARNPRLSDDQATLVGLVGEWLAYRWLKRQYRVVPAEAWVSAYRQDALGLGGGDDSLGYDFRLHRGPRTRYFEVKSTPGDDLEFQLTENEIRAATAHADRYSIIFIRRVLQSDRELMVLPNPLTGGTRRLFAQRGGGLTYRFRLG